MLKLKPHLKRIVPEALLLSLLVLRRAAEWKRAGLIFVHVPKNGGTSINDAVYGRFMGHYRVSDIERVWSDLLQALPSLAVTRNPWARTYSAWNFARKGAAMVDGAQIYNARRYQGEGFDSFERFVMEWLPGRDLDREDYVFRPQAQFLLTRRGEIGVDHLGRLEEPESYIPWLESVLSTKIEQENLNSTSDSEAYRSAFTPEMIDMVARCYSDDFKIVEYDF